MSAEIVMVCGCGRVYTREQWEQLEHGGELRDDYEKLELRHCVCGSTRALVVEVYRTDDEAEAA